MTPTAADTPSADHEQAVHARSAGATRQEEAPQQRLRVPAMDDNLRRLVQLLAALLILFFFWSISLAKVIILPIVLGLLIALTLAPLTRFLQKFRIPPAISAIVLIVSISAGAIYGVYMLRVPAQMMVEEAPKIQQELRIKFWSLLRNVDKVKEATQALKQVASGGQDNAESTKVIVQNGPDILRTAVASAAGTGSTIAVAMVLAMFLLGSGGMFQQKLVESFDDFGSKRRSLRISRDIERQISRYLAAITVINAGLGLAIGIAMQLLGMPYAILWGVAGFALNYLPYLGAVVGIGGAAAIALVTFDNTAHALLVPIAYMTLTSLEGHFITPYMVGRQLRLNTPAVFLAVIFWAWLWGVAGALLAVPVLVVVKVVCDNVPVLQNVARFLGGVEGGGLSRDEQRRRRRARAEVRRIEQAHSQPGHMAMPHEPASPVGAPVGSEVAHGPSPGMQPAK